MKFLCSFLRHHLMGKRVVASPNVSCFLRLESKPVECTSASDWSCCVGNLIQPIRSTTQIWVVMRHQYGISVLVSQTSFGRKPVVASPNVGCFLRLVWILAQKVFWPFEKWAPGLKHLCIGVLGGVINAGSYIPGGRVLYLRGLITGTEKGL